MALKKISNQCPKIGNYASIAVDEFTKDPPEMVDFVRSAEAKKMREKIYIFRKLKNWIESQHDKNKFDFLDSPTQTSLAASKARKEILDELSEWIENN